MPGFEHLFELIPRPGDGVYGRLLRSANRSEFVLGIHAEVTAAAPAGSPIEIGVTLLVGPNHSSLRVDHFEFEKIIADEADRPLQRPDSPAERDSANPDGRTVAEAADESLPRERFRDSSHSIARSHDNRSFFLIQLEGLQVAYIDDDTPVDLRQVDFEGVPSASWPNGDIILATPFNGVRDVLRFLSEDKHFGELVRMRIPVLTCRVVPRIAFEDNSPGKLRFFFFLSQLP